MLKRLNPDFLIALMFLLVAILFFAPATLGNRTIIPADNLYQGEPWKTHREEVGVPEVPHNALLSDLVLQNYQWKLFIKESIEEREIPLWQANQLGGTPFFANGQHSMLYPFSILYYILPLSTAFVWFTVSQLWLAAFLMYLYCRGIGLSRIAGVIAALTVELSSFYIVSTVHPMIQAGAAWLPLLLLMIEYVIQEKPFWGTDGKPSQLPWILLGAIGLGMVHLAGHVEITYYTLLVMAIYTALRLIILWFTTHETIRTLFKPAILLVLMVVLGFGVGAIQFIPNIEAANDSFRTEREETSYDTVVSYALPNRHVAKFIIPNIFGNPAHHEYLDVFTGEIAEHDWSRENPENTERPIRITNTDFGIKNYVEGGAYVGLLPLLLAGYGLFSLVRYRNKSPQDDKSDPPYQILFLLILLIALSFAFGLPSYALLYYGLPGIDQLHTPFRWLWVITIAIAVLAAFGVEKLKKHAEKSDQRSSQVLGGSVLGVGFLTFIALIFSRLSFSTFEPLVSRIYDGLAGANTVFQDVESFYSYQFSNVLIFAIMLMLSGIAFLLIRSKVNISVRNHKIALWQILLPLIVIVDLSAATYDFNTFSRKEWLEFKPPAVSWLETEYAEADQPFRIHAYQWEESILDANSGWHYDFQDIRGYDSLFSREYAQLMNQVVPQGQLQFNRIAPIFYNQRDALASPILDQLNVEYVLTDWLIMDSESIGYEEAQYFESLRIYRNTEVLPRAYTVAAPENGTTYQIGEQCSPLSRPVLESVETTIQDQSIPPLSGTCHRPEPATIVSYNDTEVTIEVTVAEDSWLVLADNYANGWRAFVSEADSEDEQQSDIERVNWNLRGIRLDAGSWIVRFDYSPASFQLGGFTSFISGMLIIFLAVIWLWRTFIAETAEQDTSSRIVKNSLAPIILNLFNRGIDFAFAFIMLRILGPFDAGIYYYAIVIFGWFDIFTNFGLNTLLTREVSRDKSMAGRYIFNTSLLRIGLALLGIPVLALVLFIRNETIAPALDSTAIIAIVLLYVGLIPNSITTGLSALFYAFEKAEYPAAIATITTLVKVTFGLGALLLGWGVIGLAGASIITNFVTFLIMARLAYPLIKENWSPTPDGALQRLMMRESWALMINHLLATVFFKSDVILMEAINGVKIVGIYSTSYKWLDALNIIPAFFTMALLPIMSRQGLNDRTGLKRNYVLGIKLLVIVALPVAVITTFLAEFLIGLLGGPEFLPDGAIALQIMIWSIPLGWMNSLTQYVLIAIDRQRQITGAFIVAVSFNIIANLVFLPQFSYRAAAITTIISELVLLVGFYYLLKKPLGNINWFNALWKPWAASIVMLGCLVITWEFIAIGSMIVCGVVYLGTLLLLQPFNEEELQRLLPILPAPIKRIFRQGSSA